MAYRLLDSASVVQVFSSALVSDALLCSIISYPSGSRLVRTVPQAEFQADSGAGILESLSDAVESILGEGIAVAASGTQSIDSGGFVADQVVFTVRYVPTYQTPGVIEGEVTVPVDVLTADQSLLGSVAGFDSAPELILAEYNRLKALAGE
jgi:hypothetical protein